MTADLLDDTIAFVDLLSKLHRVGDGTHNLFLPGEVIITRAPGRLDVMGGIADYSGSLVLPFPIAAATHAAIQLNNQRLIRIHSLRADAETPVRKFEMPLEAFATADGPIAYASAREMFKRNPPDHWAAYVAGAFLVLMREKQVAFDRGASIIVSSDVPEGKGVSSSAALEVASMQAIATAYEIPISPIELSVLCQKVENLIAGAPCGVMDQMTAVCGETNHLLSLLCQPATVNGTIRLPGELGIWGIDSGIRHSVGGADYGTVRTAAFMGLRIISEMAGERWCDYLANITPDSFQKNFAKHLPDKMRGEEFLQQYGGINDSVTEVDPEQIYPIGAATSHPIYEHARVSLFADILRNWEGLHQAEVLGELMYQSHESYSKCGLGSVGTDELVKLVREIGPAGGLCGARITGGGSGGTVAVLGHGERAPASIARVAATYARNTGYQPIIISGSSPGAAAFGSIRVNPRKSAA